MKNYYKVIISLVLLLLGAALVYWFWPENNINKVPASITESGGSLYSPEFMTDKEKESFGLPSETRVQVISREQDGNVSVYKIIRNEQDVVSNPSQLSPISPRGLETNE